MTPIGNRDCEGDSPGCGITITNWDVVDLILRNSGKPLVPFWRLAGNSLRKLCLVAAGDGDQQSGRLLVVSGHVGQAEATIERFYRQFR